MFGKHYGLLKYSVILVSASLLTKMSNSSNENESTILINYHLSKLQTHF